MLSSAIESALRVQFVQFKQQYGREYPTPEHEQYRFEMFQLNMARAAEMASLNPSATFGVTQFSDLHPLEFRRMFLGFRPAVSAAGALLRRASPLTDPSRYKLPFNSTMPAQFDWRKPDDGRPVAVTPVRDQGQCGGCWAFSATNAVESAWILSGKPSVELSIEQTIDCDVGDQGCNGGDTVSAFAYMAQAGGIEAEADYPFTVCIHTYTTDSMKDPMLLSSLCTYVDMG